MAESPPRTKKRKRKPGVNETALRDRENEAMKLHVAGATLALIGVRLATNEGRERPYTESAVSKMIRRGLDRATFAGARELRQVQWQRLELVHGRLLQLFLSTEATIDQRIKLAAQITNVNQRVARLFGLDAAQRIELAAAEDRMLEVVRTQVSEDDYERILEALASGDSGGTPGEAPGGEAAEGSTLN